ncbi:MAG TPA: ATP-binding protein, partial [Ktedonobacterales bacterium]|nr:ATP-binding protein [Ktedonobacterales bacterium]
VALAVDERWVSVSVSDDGVGLQSERARETEGRESDQTDEQVGKTSGDISTILAQPAETAGTRGGLLTHGALIALVGGALTVHSVPATGATVTIRVPHAAPTPMSDSAPGAREM